MAALGEAKLLQRCQKLDDKALRGLWFMMMGAMTETDAWPTFYMVLSEFLPTWEESEGDNDHR